MDLKSCFDNHPWIYLCIFVSRVCFQRFCGVYVVVWRLYLIFFLTKMQSYDCEVSVSYFTKYILVRRHHTRLGLTERVWIELAWLDEKKPTVSCLTLNLSCTFVFHIPKNQIKILNFLSCYHVDIKLSALVRCIHEKLVMRI